MMKKDQPRLTLIGRHLLLIALTLLIVTPIAADTVNSNLTVTGRVGIGTTDPQNQLHVNGSSRFDGGYLILQDGATLTGYIGDAVNLGFGRLTHEDLAIRGVDGIGFTTNNGASDAMYIRSDGNVGIGTTDPQATLHVTGDLQVDGNIAAKYQ